MTKMAMTEMATTKIATPHCKKSLKQFSYKKNCVHISTKTRCLSSITNHSHDPFIITTPLYQENVPPDIRCAHSSVAGDVIAKFQKLKGRKTMYITGTRIEAEDENISSGGHLYKDMWKCLGITDNICISSKATHKKLLQKYQTISLNGDEAYKNTLHTFLINCKDDLQGLKLELDPIKLGFDCDADAVRYYLLRGAANQHFFEHPVMEIANHYLGHHMEHLLTRALWYLRYFSKSMVPIDAKDALFSSDVNIMRNRKLFINEVRRQVLAAKERYEQRTLSSVCEVLANIGDLTELFMIGRTLASKNKKGNVEIAIKDLTIIAEALRILALAISPITPRLSWRMYSQLGYSIADFQSATWIDTNWGGLMAGQTLGEPNTLYEDILITVLKDIGYYTDHYEVSMDPLEDANEEKMLHYFVKTLARVVGSEDAAASRIYKVQIEKDKKSFWCIADREIADRLRLVDGVRFVKAVDNWYLEKPPFPIFDYLPDMGKLFQRYSNYY